MCSSRAWNFATLGAYNVFPLITSKLSKFVSGNIILHCLKLEEWEWQFVRKVLKPIKTYMQAAPESRLKFLAVNVNHPQKLFAVKIYIHVENMI